MDRKIAFLEHKLNNLISNNNISLPLDQSNSQELFDKLDKKINEIPKYDDKLNELEHKINEIPKYDDKLTELENNVKIVLSKMTEIENNFNIILSKIAEMNN